MKENIILCMLGTQLLRQIELKVRKLKDEHIGMSSIGELEEAGNIQKQISLLMKKYKEICNVSGLKPKLERMRVSRI